MSVKTGKLTGRLLAKAMRAFLQKAREPPKGKSGKQSLRSLTKQGASLSNIEITGDNIGTFRRFARKYNVGFALKRDDSETPPKWIVFFKAKDADAMTAAFAEYSKAQLKHKSRKLPMQARYDKYNQFAKVQAAPAKNRKRGDREL